MTMFVFRASIAALLFLAAPAFAAVDPTAPIPGDACIRHDEMLARMAAQFHGAKVGLVNPAPFDTSGRKLEAYFDPVTSIWMLTIVTRSLNTAGAWTVRAGSQSCLLGVGDPISIPAP